MPSATRVVLSRTFEDELLSFVLRFDDPEEQRQRAGDVPFPTRAKGKLSALHASLTKTGFAVSSVEACLENPTIASVPAATAWLCKRAPRDHLPALWVDPRHKGHAAGSAPQAAVPSTSPTGTGAGEASDAAAGSAERRTQGGGAPAAEKRDGSTEGTEQAPPGSEKTQDGSAAPSGGDRDRGHHGGPTTEQAPASGRAAESEQTQDGASLPGGGGGRDRDHTHDTDSPGPTTAGGDGLEPSPVAVQPEQVPASGRPAESEQTQDGASLPGGGGDRDRDRDHAHDDDGGPTGEDGGDGLETSPEALQADAAAACESAAAPEPTPADEEQSGSDDGGDEEESADAPDHSNKNSTVSQPASEAKPGTEGGGSGAKAKAPEPAPPAKKPEKPAKDKKEAKEKKDKKDKKEKKDKKDKDKKDKKEKKDKAHDPAPEASAQDDDPPPQAPDDKKKKKKANTKGRNPLKAQHLERKAEQEQQRASEAPEDPKDKRQQQIAQELRALGGRPPTELLKEYAAKRRLQVQWERQRSQKEDPQGTVRIMGVLVDPTQRTRETQRTEYHPRGAETFPSFKPAMEHAATSILYHILHPQNIPLYRSMLPEFRALWLDWASVDDDERQRALCSDEERKNTFLDRVMARDRELVKRATHLKLWKETPVDPEKALAFEVLRVDDVIEPEPEDQCEGAGLLGNQPMDMNDDSASEASVEDWEDETPAGFSQADLEARRAWCDRLAAGPPMQSYWDDLPISSVKRQFLYELKKAHCVVVSSETGSGKTTQIPRYVLEEAVLKKGLSTVNIYVCEPRKLSAVAAATRVAQELNIKLDSTSIIGYRYRGAKHVSPACRLTFCTTGILLRLLRNDPLLSNITHVIVDEVHERSLVTDFLLQILKDVMYVRRDLRVILMSATIEPEFYSNYFNRMPIVTAPGRTYPVAVSWLEDVLEATGFTTTDKMLLLTASEQHTRETEVRDLGKRFSKTVMDMLCCLNEATVNPPLIEACLRYVLSAFREEEDGAVLVFLPGIQEIDAVHRHITASDAFPSDTFIVMRLHSMISTTEDHMRVFNTAPRGMRKIVLSTNIAEVSVTIPDVVFVIDTGLTKESRYDATTKTKCLVEMQVSKASARQRWGRAGRVRSGHCLNLYASTTFQKFAESQQPEMLRCSLEDICLQIISLGIDTDVQKFLSKSLTPPNPVQVSVAMSLLRNLGALTTENRITPLGRALAVTPVDVRLAKVLVLSQLLGCSDVVSVIVAALSIGSLFLLHSNTQIEYAEHDSDHMAYPSVIAEWKSSRKRHKPQGSALGISDARAKDTAQLADDLLDQLRQEKGLSMKVPMPGLSAAQKSSLVSACLCAGLEGNILITENLVQLPSVPQQQGQACRWTSKSSGEVALRRSAIDHYGRPKYPFLVYSEKLLIRHKAFARDCTVVHPMAVLLFGHKVMLAHAEGSVTINGWLKFEGATRTLSTVLAFRDAMHHMLDARLRGAPVAHVQHAEMIKLLVELISL